MAAMKLTVNETKTPVRQVPAETFDFLGYTFGLHWTHRTKRKLLCVHAPALVASTVDLHGSILSVLGEGDEEEPLLVGAVPP